MRSYQKPQAKIKQRRRRQADERRQRGQAEAQRAASPGSGPLAALGRALLKAQSLRELGLEE